MSGSYIPQPWSASDPVIVTSAMQAALISIVTANTGSAPTDGQVIGFEASTGNLIWTTGGTSYTASADFSDARNSMYVPLLFEDF